MARVEVVMPQMGESVMEGTIIEWTRKIGDKVNADETLLEIATDKVDTEVPSPESGVLVEILAEEGDTVEVGHPIAIIETDPDAAAEAGASDKSGEEDSVDEDSVDEESASGDEDSASEKSDGQKEAAHSESGAEEQSAKQTSASSGENGGDGEGEGDGEDVGRRIEVVMPQMGESVMEGTIIEWSKKPGDPIEVDETLLEVATDKVDTEIPSPESGTLVEILAEAGETVEVGAVIAVIQTGKAPAGDGTAAGNGRPEKTSDEVPAQVKSNGKKSAPAAEGSSDVQRTGSDGRFFSPLVRSIAREEGISQAELEKIQGSGQGGRVTKEDILAYVGNRESAPSETPKQVSDVKDDSSREKISAGELNIQRPAGDVEIIKMDRMRKMIAEHMVRSRQTSAHVTTFTEVDVTGVVRWRERNKQEFLKKADTKLTYTPLFIESIIQAISEFPLINSSVDGDEIRLKRDINFGLAVALGDGGTGGLIVPVIKEAQKKNLAGLAQAVSSLAGKARNKSLNPDDLVGGTITLTNYGSVGNLMGTPIINQPQVAIIGTGVIQKRPVVIEKGGEDLIAIRHMMYLSMSYDHRIIDGAHGGAFLNRIKQLLEEFDTDRPV